MEDSVLKETALSGSHEVHDLACLCRKNLSCELECITMHDLVLHAIHLRN